MTGTGLGDMFHHAFIIHALLAGGATAALCGLAGYFMVLRGQVFAGDALGHVAYTGAMGALAAGVDLRAGLFSVPIAAGLALGAGSTRIVDDVAIGSFFSWMLGLGVLFLTYYLTNGSGANSTANVNVLFGSIFGISDSATMTAVALSAGLGLLIIVMGRPLLFATV
ncbi:MAG: metal ABC transporter permease, partial [Mycobacteriaceae bacterium]|nr:metal ABC transporter permease [Mycobacteriaceae bacterium]